MGKLLKLTVVVYRLKISLKYIKPPIWRKVLVPARISLFKLHQVIQAAMGWEDCHLHQFIINRQHFGEIDPEEPQGPRGMSNEKTARLHDLVVEEKAKFLYEYDFGDSWLHEVVLEKILTRPPDNKYPICVQGRRRCPPEDCGGPPGYDNLLAALADPHHPEHDDVLEWLGGAFDPEAFDKDQVNRALARLQ